MLIFMKENTNTQHSQLKRNFGSTRGREVWSGRWRAIQFPFIFNYHSSIIEVVIDTHAPSNSEADDEKKSSKLAWYHLQDVPGVIKWLSKFFSCWVWDEKILSPSSIPFSPSAEMMRRTLMPHSTIISQPTQWWMKWDFTHISLRYENLWIEVGKCLSFSKSMEISAIIL